MDRTELRDMYLTDMYTVHVHPEAHVHHETFLDHFPMHHADPSAEGWVLQRTSSADGSIEVDVLLPRPMAEADSEPGNMRAATVYEEPDMDTLLAGMRLLVGQGALLLLAVGLLLVHTCMVERRMRRVEDAAACYRMLEDAQAASMAGSYVPPMAAAYFPLCDKV